MIGVDWTQEGKMKEKKEAGDLEKTRNGGKRGYSEMTSFFKGPTQNK